VEFHGTSIKQADLC